MARRITAEEAAALIQDNMTLGVGGFGAYAAPDELLSALAERYERLGSPRALTAVCGISPGSNRPDGRGLARLRAPGLLDTVMAGHFRQPARDRRAHRHQPGGGLCPAPWRDAPPVAGDRRPQARGAHPCGAGRLCRSPGGGLQGESKNPGSGPGHRGVSFAGRAGLSGLQDLPHRRLLHPGHLGRRGRQPVHGG